MSAADVEAFAARAGGPPSQTIIDDGPAAEAIPRRAPGFDLIVLGTRRLHGARRWWLGSVAERVVRESAVPVLVVPAGSSLETGARLVAAGDERPGVDGWVTAMAGALRSELVRAGAIGTCSPQRFRHAELVAIRLSGDERELDTIGC